MCLFTIVPQEELGKPIIVINEDNEEIFVRLGVRKNGACVPYYVVSVETQEIVWKYVWDGFQFVYVPVIEFIPFNDGKCFMEEADAKRYQKEIAETYAAKSFVHYLIKRYCK